MIQTRIFLAPAIGAFAIAGMAVPAHAELPKPVRDMIEAAIATGNKDKVAAVVEVAKKTQPDDVGEIDALNKTFLDQQARLAEEKKARDLEAIRTAGIFKRWKGKGEFGAFRSTGNGDDTGLTGSLSLKRTGIDWDQKITARAEFQRSNGKTSRERFFASYEPNYKINKQVFAYGLLQYERDRIQGYSGRYAVSGGIGYKVIDQPNLHLSIKAGPAYRLTDYRNGTEESRLAALFGADFDWSITKRLKFTQGANAVAESGSSAVAIIDSSNTSISLVSGLEAKVSNRLSTRFSYTIDYNSNPPAGSVKTDTLSRFTLVYGF
ncbi:DUF481 domain-containing protein [Altererythrobacter sp. FM1]|uniref:DUF481 domain-containing protein n=1 Tax=Tsuneonella flava TaxID=2055955 RepID=UPI000C803F8C|nr:DUF481 domain-containing protein [Tsuneonella flava]ROT95205.1 DUF481 domain-containing protein [Altererythrobacter sp. FM1]